MPLVLALDQGTTSSRAIVFDETGAKRGVAQIALPQIFPQPGWVEHDPEVLWSQQLQVAREALEQAGITADKLSGIGVTNQRETAVVWDRSTGKPIHNAIVWQDRRTSAACEALVAAGADGWVRERTGLGIDPYFSAAKIAWILDEVPGARERAEAGELACGTIDTWLIWNLTGGAVHVTDASNASRTQLLDIAKREWDAELAALFRVPMGLLPTVVSSSEVVGETAAEVLGAAVPISGICGDQQAALVGNGELADSPQGVQALAESVPNSGGVVFVPALTGLGAPMWDPYARGAIFGLTRGATNAHLARAGMEAIPLQVSDLIGAMIADSGHEIAQLRVDGGVTVNELVMQILADVLGRDVLRAQVAESTALGAAYLAGRATGVWESPADLPALTGVDRQFTPSPHAAEDYARLKVLWADAVKRSMKWERE